MSASNVKEVPSYKTVDLGNIIINENSTGFTTFQKNTTIEDRISSQRTTIVYNPGDRIGVYKMNESDQVLVLQAELTIVKPTNVGIHRYSLKYDKINFDDICIEIGSDLLHLSMVESSDPEEPLQLYGCILTDRLLVKLNGYANKSFTAAIILD